MIRVTGLTIELAPMSAGESLHILFNRCDTNSRGSFKVYSVVDALEISETDEKEQTYQFQRFPISSIEADSIEQSNKVRSKKY